MRQLSARAPPNLVDLGFVNDVAGFYAFVDVTLVPSTRSWREAAGLTALEAIARGTPVVANDSGALPEAVVHERTGLIVEDNDVEMFVRHIQSLRDLPDLRMRMARNGIDHARLWKPERVLDEHVEAYRDLMREVGVGG